MIVKRWDTGTSSWIEHYPKTTHTQIVASGTPSSSNFLRGDGVWTTPNDNNDFVCGLTFNTSDGVLTVSNTNGNYTVDLDGRYAYASHSHGNITSAGAIGSTSGLMVKTTTSGVLTTLSAGTTSQFLRGDGTWQTPTVTPQTTYMCLITAVPSTSTTPSNVAGLTVNITAGKQYNMRFIGVYNTVATTTGGKLSLNFPTGAGSVYGTMDGDISTAVQATRLHLSVTSTSSILTTTGVTSAGAPHYIGFDVIVSCTTSGTFCVQWGSEVSGSSATLQSGSTLVVTQLN